MNLRTPVMSASEWACFAVTCLRVLQWSRRNLRQQWVLPILLAISTPGSILAAEAKLYPVDDGPKDSSFLEFRQKLTNAAKVRDLAFVLSVLEPTVVNSFGGSEGIEGFKEIWSPEKTDTKLWETLLLILAMGGSYTPSEPEPQFWAPYVFSRWPSDFDSFEHAAILAEKVRVRSRPDPKAPVVATLSFDIVKFADQSWLPAAEAGQNAWVKIVTLAGVEGLVSSRYVRSPIDYRIGFVKKNGKWLIKVFVAGD